jgi:hypothetical protein
MKKVSTAAALLPQNVQFREQKCDFGGQNLANSLLFSLLAGNLAGESLASDCAHRQMLGIRTSDEKGNRR